MSAHPPLTVVTSTYHWPAALALAIRSVLDQTFGDFEYLVVGDGCADETEEVVRGFGDPRIVWRNLPENTGNQSGVNKLALEWARGEAIAYLNHDDLWFPDHLQTLIEPLRAYKLDVVNSLCIAVAPPGFHQRHFHGQPLHPTSDGRFDVQPMTSTVMHTVAAARAAGGWIDWRETAEIPTYDFFRRLRNLNGAFAVAPSVTSLKFHSGSRRNSYLKREASEQEAWARRMREDPQLRYKQAMLALMSHSMKERPPVIPQPLPKGGEPPGWQIEQWRRNRGLKPMLDLGADERAEIPEIRPDASSPARLGEHGAPIVLPRPR